METNQPGNHVGPASPPENGKTTKEMGFFDAVIEPPSWFDKDYLEKALQKYEGDAKLKVSLKL